MTDLSGARLPGIDPGAAVRADRCRQAAAALRRAADEIARSVHDLAAFDRSDVWQGAVATRFRHDLDRWRARLGDRSPVGGLDLTSEAIALADRLDGRAANIELDAAGGDAIWWGRRP
jgi:hypothetical protein